MGKSTAVRSIIGLVPVTRGRVVLDGTPVQAWPSYRIARAGIGLVPEGRQVFPALTVRENLVATARAATGDRPAWTLDRVLRLFPTLRERQGQRGGTLSGGEQQMLAVGRALLTNPRLLVLDEATEGLAPLVRAEIWKCLAGLKAEGQALLVIDKNLAELAPLADRACVLEKGRVAWEGTPAALIADAAAKHRYLGV
jgi:branched-chain amino acid transport system ATP-binding protein